MQVYFSKEVLKGVIVVLINSLVFSRSFLFYVPGGFAEARRRPDEIVSCFVKCFALLTSFLLFFFVIFVFSHV